MLSTVQLILIAAFVLVVVLIFLTLNSKEKFAPADFATLNNISSKNTIMIPPGPVVGPNIYKPTYAMKITYGGRVKACPPGTTDVGNKCLTSEFGPRMKNGKCPRNMIVNDSLDLNMQCRARFSPRKVINGVKRCYESEIDTGNMKCAAGNDTVFTKKEYINGKWVCPTGTEDTGFTLDSGDNMTRQCRILP